jgi:hypothetical protein
MLHPQTALRVLDPAVGSGIVATAPIPRGTITWVLDPLDRALGPAELARLPAAYADLIERFTYGDGAGRRMLLWDLSRHMNHACAPNCAGTLFGFEVALRDIAPGEELTNDYGTFGSLDEAVECRCGAPGCRGWINQPPTPAQRTALDAALRAALSELTARPQPLAELLAPERLAEACAANGVTGVTIGWGAG